MFSSMVLSQLNSFWGKAVDHMEERHRISDTCEKISNQESMHAETQVRKRLG